MLIAIFICVVAVYALPAPSALPTNCRISLTIAGGGGASVCANPTEGMTDLGMGGSGWLMTLNFTTTDNCIVYVGLGGAGNNGSQGGGGGGGGGGSTGVVCDGIVLAVAAGGGGSAYGINTGDSYHPIQYSANGGDAGGPMARGSPGYGSFNSLSGSGGGSPMVVVACNYGGVNPCGIIPVLPTGSSKTGGGNGCQLLDSTGDNLTSLNGGDGFTQGGTGFTTPQGNQCNTFGGAGGGGGYDSNDIDGGSGSGGGALLLTNLQPNQGSFSGSGGGGASYANMTRVTVLSGYLANNGNNRGAGGDGFAIVASCIVDPSSSPTPSSSNSVSSSPSLYPSPTTSSSMVSSPTPSQVAATMAPTLGTAGIVGWAIATGLGISTAFLSGLRLHDIRLRASHASASTTELTTFVTNGDYASVN